MHAVNKIKIASESVDRDKAEVAIDLPSGQKLNVVLSRDKSKWLIDNIENVAGQITRA